MISDENNLQDSFCPVSKEQGVRHNLRQVGYGLQDQLDLGENQTGAGPMADNLKQFYKKFGMSRLWYTELCTQTKTICLGKIILPQL
jgi:hypothetical protein